MAVALAATLDPARRLNAQDVLLGIQGSMDNDAWPPRMILGRHPYENVGGSEHDTEPTVCLDRQWGS